ncbi:hypothetical protein Poli38472_006520 [Pythium oligandrum]|uniref:protein-disulfide reductase n=1 Tax=Pythium oligandrum TaxID=41045 RepID=A0A8K1C521_PYTOL|nr:hypothetical protein Poli38472_006520 [Pythium oligandrum]|eukprot:TMW56510.1 hypothetical protein Poli38472_006520 [Pythium oligandrum]
MEAILAGQKLLNKSGEIVSVADALAQKKVIGLYFSAHWCPPCRKFTPLLSYVYDEIKEEHDDIEIVFVSSDRETAQFDEYYTEMPWLALPWAESRDLIPELREKFAVQFIPTLIFFNDKGEIIEREGRTFVEQNMRNVDNLVAALRK